MHMRIFVLWYPQFHCQSLPCQSQHPFLTMHLQQHYPGLPHVQTQDHTLLATDATWLSCHLPSWHTIYFCGQYELSTSDPAGYS